MRLLLLPLSLAAVCAIKIAAAEPDTALPSRESIEWCDIWISHANETNHPRVQLIGDSIVRDYYPEVEKRLAGKAFVARLSTSRFVADPVLLKEIEMVLKGTKFDVVVFNNGMHGWQHSETEYRKAFPKLIKTIRAHAPKAKLIWATTTPLRDGKGVTGDTKAEYSDERIAARNALAAEVVAAQKIPTADLNAATRGRPELHSDNVHFNGQGSQILAALVSAAVEKLLPLQSKSHVQ
ncbi:MAG: SGNH/GDSL hydrolase family protein [Verrucomicrobia subdivision 3 bacterium]|nr:SGNH/GDSL hydrolase family protein [Limisphaerales bacterium]